MAASQTPKRQTNLDLLRILSMLFIVLFHSVIHSGVLEEAAQGSLFSKTYTYFIYAITQICVNCYVLLSGYFLVSASFKLKKLFTLWLQTAVYSLIIKGIFMMSGRLSFSIASLASCLVPITTGRYWFITIYFGMYLLSPFLNTAIKALGRKNHSILNVLLFALMSMWSSFHPSIAGMNSGGGWGLSWFVVLYFTGAWLRLYYRPNYKVLPKVLAWLGVPLLMTIARLVAEKIGIGILTSAVTNWFRYDSAPVYLASLLFFLIFMNLSKPKGTAWIKGISYMAPLTFGVYLIHDHPDVRLWLWEVSTLSNYVHKVYFPLIQLVIVVGIFFICILIDSLRSRLFRPLEQSSKLHRRCEGITKRFLSLFEKEV